MSAPQATVPDWSLSVVSHGHLPAIGGLLNDCRRLLDPQRFEILLTLNRPETLPPDLAWGGALQVLRNERPLGFAANHNAALGRARGRWLAALDPDLRLHSDPFTELATALTENAPNTNQVVIKSDGRTIVSAGGFYRNEQEEYVSDGELWVHADRDLVAQAMANLLDNAVKYTPVRGRIQMRAQRERDGAFALVVADSGPGIPEADRERAVERFVRLEQSRSQPGRGLGLSLAAAVAEAHRGELRLGEGLGSGSMPGLEVALVLPAASSKAITGGRMKLIRREPDAVT